MTHTIIHRDLAYQSLEGHSTDKELGGFLVASDFAQRDCSWPESLCFSFWGDDAWCWYGVLLHFEHFEM